MGRLSEDTGPSSANTGWHKLQAAGAGRGPGGGRQLRPPRGELPSPPSVRRMWSRLNEWLWQDRFWLPPNHTWADLEDRDGLVYAHPQDLLAALPLALALVAMRFTFER